MPTVLTVCPGVHSWFHSNECMLVLSILEYNFWWKVYKFLVTNNTCKIL